MKFNAILVLWGLLVGYVAYHQGALDKLANYVKPDSRASAAASAEPGGSQAVSDPNQWVPRKVKVQDRGEGMHAYRGFNESAGSTNFSGD